MTCSRKIAALASRNVSHGNTLKKTGWRTKRNVSARHHPGRSRRSRPEHASCAMAPTAARCHSKGALWQFKDTQNPVERGRAMCSGRQERQKSQSAV